MVSTGTYRLFSLFSEIYGNRAAYRYRKKLLKLVLDNKIPPRSHSPSQADVVLIAYGDHLSEKGKPPLRTLAEFCQSRLKDSVNTIHLLPHYPYTSDDGFAVSDYLAVNPELGSWDDVHKLGENFRLMFDGVFNHVSSSHPWFKAFQRGEPYFCDFFIDLDKKTDVSMVTRPRTSPLLVAFETSHGQKYVWATFSADQVDLNYANPDVMLEIIDVMLEYVRHGADMIRLDAVGFVWKEVGTNSIHLPRAHAIVRLLRALLDDVAPWVQIVTETNVPHEENITYFGNGRDEANLVYNFALPPLIVHTMQTGTASDLTTWAATLDTPSRKTSFFNFTASHDGIGIRSVNKILSKEQQQAIFDKVEERGGKLSMRTAQSGKTSVYEINISFFNAVTDPGATLEKSVDQFMCSQAIALSLAGVPGIYLHSLLGSTNWQEGVEKLGYNRAINREKLEVSQLSAELADPNSLRHKVFTRYTEMLRVRRGEPAFAPAARQRVLSTYGDKIFAVERTAPMKLSLVRAFHNVSGESVSVPLRGQWQDILSGQIYKRSATLKPYQVVWLKKVLPALPTLIKAD